MRKIIAVILTIPLLMCVSKKRDINDAISLHEIGNYNEALFLVNDLIKDDGSNYVYYETKGMIYKSLDEYHNALINYESAIRLEPEVATLFSNAGDAAFQLGDSLKAMNYFFQAYRLDSDTELINYNLGIITWLFLKEKETALSYFLKELKVNRSSDVLNAIAQINLNLGNTEIALQYFHKSLSLGGNNQKTFMLMGLAYLESNQFDFAIKKFSKVIEVNNTNCDLLCYRSIAYYNNNLKAACEDLKKLTTLGMLANYINDPDIIEIQQTCAIK
jgi:tetratricopeptide (TPR) repeat protein